MIYISLFSFLTVFDLMTSWFVFVCLQHNKLIALFFSKMPHPDAIFTCESFSGKHMIVDTTLGFAGQSSNVKLSVSVCQLWLCLIQTRVYPRSSSLKKNFKDSWRIFIAQLFWEGGECLIISSCDLLWVRSSIDFYVFTFYILVSFLSTKQKINK